MQSKIWRKWGPHAAFGWTDRCSGFIEQSKKDSLKITAARNDIRGLVDSVRRAVRVSKRPPKFDVGVIERQVCI